MRLTTTTLLLLICVNAPAASPEAHYSSARLHELQLLDYYQAKAREGDAHAQFRVGWAYETGDGLPQDPIEAAQWYERAASQGHRNARLNLALLEPDSALTLAPEEKQFLDLFEQAIDGARNARIAVAQQAVLGRYNRPELKQIYHWLTKLAREGDIQAQHLLATFYIQGRGVPQNFVHAYSWFSIAAASGHPPAITSRDAVAGLMSPSQLEEGQNLSMELYRKYVEERDHPEAPELDNTGNVSNVRFQGPNLIPDI